MQETHQSSVNATRVHADMDTQCTRTQVCTRVYIRLYMCVCVCVREEWEGEGLKGGGRQGGSGRKREKLHGR